MNRYERAKVWAKKHQEELVISGVGVAIVGLFVLVVKADMARLKRLNAEFENTVDSLNEWYTIEQEAAGRI